MKVLLDTNIWLDIALRSSQFPESLESLKFLEEKQTRICFPLCAYTTVYYLIGKFLNKTAASDFTDSLLTQHIEFLSFSERDVQRAKQLNFKDHEDACVCSTAIAHNCQLIITRNEKDFRYSPIKVRHPKKILQNILPHL